MLVKAARGESPPSCTLFSNIGMRFMAEPLRRHKIPPSTSYITAQLSACAHVFSLSVLLLELTAIVLKYFPYALLSVSFTWFQTWKERHKAWFKLQAELSSVFWWCILDVCVLFANDWCALVAAVHQLMTPLWGSLQGQTQMSCRPPVGCLRPAAPAVGPRLHSLKSRRP